MRELCYIIEFMVLFQSLMQSSNPKDFLALWSSRAAAADMSSMLLPDFGAEESEVHYFSPFDLLVPL